jgi:hypothetical protein
LYFGVICDSKGPGGIELPKFVSDHKDLYVTAIHTFILLLGYENLAILKGKPTLSKPKVATGGDVGHPK